MEKCCSHRQVREEGAFDVQLGNNVFFRPGTEHILNGKLFPQTASVCVCVGGVNRCSFLYSYYFIQFPLVPFRLITKLLSILWPPK